MFTASQLESLTGPQGPKGDSYILTNDDKDEIAQLVFDLLPLAEDGEY
jgi:hypothetical protein